jgi:nucleoside-diphosphate-sugar epimerase
MATRYDPFARKYDLSAPVPPGLLDDVDLLIHASYDFGLRKRADIWKVNVDGSAALFEAAQRSGVARIIMLSSMSAYAGTAQLYGQAKLAIESQTVAAGGIVARSGLVYGTRPGGMAGALQRIARLPLVPVVGGGKRQFPVHEDDLVMAIRKLAEVERAPVVPIGIAQPQGVPFRLLLRHLGDGTRRRVYVPIPWQPVYWLLRLCESANVAVPFRSDSLLGLVRPAREVPGADILTNMGVRIRSLGMAGTTSRSDLNVETG